MLEEKWGGLLESLESCEENNDVTEKIKILKEKLAFLESSKNLKEIQHSIHFTIEERNYLNSPLLDEIYNTIFNENPICICIRNQQHKALIFYSKKLENFDELCINALFENKVVFGTKRENEIIFLHHIQTLNNLGIILSENFLWKFGQYPKILDFLIKNGVLMRIKDKDALAHAYAFGLKDVVDFLLKKPTDN